MDTQDGGLALEMGVQVPRPRRFFPPEYKAEGCRADPLDRQDGRTGRQGVGLTETAVREWFKRADLAGRRTDGLVTSEREELRRLRRENRDLREEREILRKAAVFFSRETDHRAGTR